MVRRSYLGANNPNWKGGSCVNWKKEVDRFKGELSIKKSSIFASYIRFAFFGLVGGGKSVTSGIFAVSITPEGKIGWIDGEGMRSGFAIDIVAEMAAKELGGDKQDWINRFEVIHVDPPFHPLKVTAAIDILEASGCKTIIADVMSQAWDSDGGYLDLKEDEISRMAGEDYKKRERSAMSAAAHVKPWTHGKLVSKVNSAKCNIVLCFQGKQKYNAKTFKPDDFVTPIQESGLTRTALAVGRVEAKMVNGDPQGGFCTFKGAIEQGTKYTHPALLKILPENGKQLCFSHGRALFDWCSGSKQSPPESNPTSESPSDEPQEEKVDLKKEIWKLLKPAYKDKAEKDQLTAATKWLREKEILKSNESLAKACLDENVMADIYAKIPIAMETLGSIIKELDR